MRQIAMVMLAWVFAVGAATAQEPEPVSPVELKLHADRYYGRVVVVEGHIAEATRERATYGINADRAGIITFGVWWGNVRDAQWDRALATCGAGFRADNECRVRVIGIVVRNESFPELFSIQQARVEFLK